MLKLSVVGNAQIRPLTLERSAILRVTTNREYPAPLRAKSALLQDDTTEPSNGFAIVLARRVSNEEKLPSTNVLRIGPDLDYLCDGDVVRVGPDGRIKTIYRREGRG